MDSWRGRVGFPADWFARQVAQADRTDGDIDTLSNRIAQIRTWTFVANRSDWLDDPEHWQGVTRGVEDKLSDALHERLAQRFVDRRTSVLMRRLRENAMLETEISKSGDVIVEGHVIGRLSGFEFVPDASGGATDAKALRGAAQKVLAGEIEARAKRLAEAADEAFVLSNDGAVRWTGEPVARLVAAENLLEPRLRLLADEQLTGPAREAVDARLAQWLKSHIEKLLGPLLAVSKAEDIAGISRGVAFQLVEALGVLERQKVADEVKGLDQETRAVLRKYGVRFGAYHIYMPGLLKPAPRTLGLLLCALKHGGLEPERARRPAGARFERTDFHRRRSRSGKAALSRGRLSRMRATRGAGRYPRATRRSDPAGALLAAGHAGRQARGRDRRARLHRHRRHDLAGRLLGRGFRLHSARARLSHGAATGTRAGSRGTVSRTRAGNSGRGGPDGPDRRRAADIGSCRASARSGSHRRTGSAAVAGGHYSAGSSPDRRSRRSGAERARDDRNLASGPAGRRSASATQARGAPSTAGSSGTGRQQRPFTRRRAERRRATSGSAASAARRAPAPRGTSTAR